MTDRWIAALFVALFVVIVVRRFRRLFGRQRFRPVGLVFVVVLMSAIATVMLLVSSTPLALKFAGAAVGAVLAMWALYLTRFGVDDAGRFYVPNGTIGLIVLVLFFGRLSMRLWGLSGLLDRLDGLPREPPGFTSNPGTMLLLFVLLGYYVAYYSGVLVCGSRPSPPVSTVS